MTAEPLVPLGDGWKALARAWALRRGAAVTAEGRALTVDVRSDQRGGAALTVDFTRGAGAVVVIVTDGTLVGPARLATTAAAATAWNAREVTPAAVLGYDRTELPLLSAVSTLPLAAHMTAGGFCATLDALLERAERLLSECHDLGQALRDDDDLTARW
ncbi:hypothetical protein ACWEL8_10520 [Streptomyces sp. NPDC004690]|uniref:hypothetical protein n=1 Tax=Streptomyces sp. NPDC007070 TaxID=3154312 RepID=UPI0033E53CC2